MAAESLNSAQVRRDWTGTAIAADIPIMGSLVTTFRRLGARALRPLCALLALFALAPALTGCTTTATMPTVLKAPYDGERVWAVLPFANESGVSAVDSNLVADRFVSEVEQVDGLRCLPLNRSLAVMQQLGITKISDIRQVYTLMRAMQVDGILIGTVTDWDPYKPLRFGAAIEVISAASEGAAKPLDLKDVTMPTADSRVDVDGALVAISQASRLFDARNNETLAELDQYGAGRADASTALGSRVYEQRIDLFMRFGAYILVRDLLEQEAARLSVPLPGGKAERAPGSK